MYKWSLILLLSFSVYSQSINRRIYPFKPFTTSKIIQRATILTENPQYIGNVLEIHKQGLERVWLKSQPWSGSYWPLIQGLIGADYSQNQTYKLKDTFSWRSNYNEFLNRKNTLLKRAKELDEWQLNLLSPSEKYDLILNDHSFSLTQKIWDYTQKWGNKKQYAFLTNIEWPKDKKNWVLENKSQKISMWEGICHGWATASGHYPRPKKTVLVKTPWSNKKISFYPNDVKGLVSLLWANSLIQDKVLMEGYRCNTNKVKKDKYGRYIDKKPETAGEDWLPRCADVHPALLHIVLANVVGKEQRSFVVDVKPKASVSNQPVTGYTISYFHPKTGKYYGLHDSIVKRKDYAPKDPFRKSRNRDSHYIVGVKVNLYYTDWVKAKVLLNDSSDFDQVKHKDFFYDLELDKNYNIVGGQWRTTKKAKSIFNNIVASDQPDFLWIVPKNWKDSFKNLDLEPWSNKNQQIPHSWGEHAKRAHDFIYYRTKAYGWDAKCKVKHKRFDKTKTIPCDFEIPQPQPLINVVNELVDLAK